MKSGFNVPNMHLGIYQKYQNFHPLIFYRYTRLRGVWAVLPPPSPGLNRVNNLILKMMAAKTIIQVFAILESV